MVLPELDATLLTFECFNDRRLIVNHCDSSIEPYLYLPGAWERWFGIESSGDTVALRPELFADPREPGWRQFLELHA